MVLRTKKNTLVDQINLLVTTTPATFNSDDENEDTRAKLVDHYDESDNSDNNLPISEIRKRNVNSLDQIDERYKGKKVSRKDIYNDNSETALNLEKTFENAESEMDSMHEESLEDVTDTDDATTDDNSDNSSQLNEDSYESDESNEGISYDSNTNVEQYSESEDDESIPEDENDNDTFNNVMGKGIQTIAQTNVETDIEKGNCIRSQLKLWESLLEIRIKLQKCLTASNQLPQHDVYKNFKTDVEYSKTLDGAKDKLKGLLNNMLHMQSLLLKQYPETKNLFVNSKKRKAEESINNIKVNPNDSMDDEIPSDTEDENEIADEKSNENVISISKKLKLDNYGEILNDNHNSYIEYRNSVIHKWNEKTRIASGKLNKSSNETTLKQIEFALSDKDKLHKRSRLKRSEYKIIGKPEAVDDNEGRRTQEYDPEIYDDDDFYHQLLRDLIEYKSSDITDPIQLSKQWIQLQNMRNKMKRKIDTRATKGRRIRYDVHNKLVNFMAPITVNDTWTDYAKDELYNSLFGKIKLANTDASH